MHDPLFVSYRLNDKGVNKADLIADAFIQLLYQLNVLCPAGREYAIVKTKLEEAAFFAKKAMAASAENQESK